MNGPADMICPGLIGAPAAQPFGGATPIVARIGLVLFTVLILGLPAYIAGIAVDLNSGETGAASVPIDFVAFWAAAKLALAGEAVTAFDPQALDAATGRVPGQDWATYAWYYPPGFHILVAPLGLIGFSPAFAVFSAASAGFYIWALHGWTRGAPGTLALAFAAPPAAFVLTTGNASLLWAAALLIGLACLVRERPRSAGLMIALMTLKPQLGLLIPVALIAGRHWRTILWAAFGTAAILALTIAVFGTGYWEAFFRTMARTSANFAVYPENSVDMVTWYGFSRQLGLGQHAAIAVQMVSLAAAAGAVALVWRRRPWALDLKLSTLCLATLVATPYAFQYELVLAVLAAMFLARAGVGAGAAGRAWLAALWLLPVPAWLIPGLEIAHYTAPALSLSAAAAVTLALRRPPA